MRGFFEAIAEWLSQIARHPRDEFDQNLIALGDFNIDRLGDPNWYAFISRGLSAPDELNNVPRTITEGKGMKSFYDQIAWFTGVKSVVAVSHLDFQPGRFRLRRAEASDFLVGVPHGVSSRPG